MDKQLIFLIQLQFLLILLDLPIEDKWRYRIFYIYKVDGQSEAENILTDRLSELTDWEEVCSFVTLQRHSERGRLVESESLTQHQFTKTVGCDVKYSSFV
jgi:hypothetical protein